MVLLVRSQAVLIALSSLGDAATFPRIVSHTSAHGNQSIRSDQSIRVLERSGPVIESRGTSPIDRPHLPQPPSLEPEEPHLEKNEQKGRDLQKLLDAYTSVPGQQFTFADLEAWGWERTSTGGPRTILPGDRCAKPVIDQLYQDRPDKHNVREITWEHEHTTTHERNGEQVDFPSTGAKAEIAYDPLGIFVRNVFSAHYSKEPGDQPLELRHISDVIFLQYQQLNEHGENKLKQLASLTYCDVVEADAQHVIDAIAVDHPKVVGYPGKTFPLGTAQFFQMLGTPLGRNAVYLLAQHKEAFGQKCIQAVNVWLEWLTKNVNTDHFEFVVQDAPCRTAEVSGHGNVDSDSEMVEDRKSSESGTDKNAGKGKGKGQSKGEGQGGSES